MYIYIYIYILTKCIILYIINKNILTFYYLCNIHILKKRQIIIQRVALMHGTNSEKLIALQEPIVVDGYVAVCDGGGGALGHPIEFIQLNRVNEKTPEICTYCGLRFVMGNAHH